MHNLKDLGTLSRSNHIAESPAYGARNGLIVRGSRLMICRVLNQWILSNSRLR